MAKNRTYPYGYKMENGATAIEPAEAEVIRTIYKEYADGKSYKAIAMALTAEHIRYMPDKPAWNKNMVARILQNSTYLGTDKYPKIIESTSFRLAQQAFKPYTHTESQDIKMLKPLLVCGICGEPIKRRLKTSGAERWYCPLDTQHIKTALTDELLLQSIEILQRSLARNPRSARQTKRKGNQVDISTIRLQNEIELAISAPNADVAALQKQITELATQKYALCQDEDNGSTELMRVIAQMSHAKLDSDSLKVITAQIKITHTTATELILKNGQIIKPYTAEKGEEPHD